MDISYWEYKTWLANVDFTVVGSGIVGLSCAIYLKKRFPEAKVLILERGILPQGASTKNAGFACFGSISEIISDLDHHTESEILDLVQERWSGIQLLRETLGDSTIGFETHGGHELFLDTQAELFENCQGKLGEINALLRPIFGQNPFVVNANSFGFKNIKPNYITHVFEGQLDTGKMMNAIVRLAQKMGIHILNGVTVAGYEENTSGVMVHTDAFGLHTQRLLLATNGFASRFLGEDILPARAQGFITQPIDDLNIQGTFHFDRGYYYFRNIDDRILFGGGRNLDFQGEQTMAFGQTGQIQKKLEHYLRTVILPNHKVEIAQRWSGIMGVGPQKKPIVKQLTNRVFCGVRMGGMGIAIGSAVGRRLAAMV